MRSRLLTSGALLLGLLLGLAQAAQGADPGVADQTLAADTGFGGDRHWKLTLGDYQYGAYSGQDVNLRRQSSDTHA